MVKCWLNNKTHNSVVPSINGKMSFECQMEMGGLHNSMARVQGKEHPSPPTAANKLHNPWQDSSELLEMKGWLRQRFKYNIFWVGGVCPMLGGRKKKRTGATRTSVSFDDGR